MSETQRWTALGLIIAATVAALIPVFWVEGEGGSLYEAIPHLGDIFGFSGLLGTITLLFLIAPVVIGAGLGIAFARKGLGYIIAILGGLLSANGVALLLVNQDTFGDVQSVPFYLEVAAAALALGGGVVGLLLRSNAAPAKRPGANLPAAPVLSTANPNAFNPMASREPRPFKQDPPKEYKSFAVTSRPPGAPAPAAEESTWEEVPEEKPAPKPAAAAPAKPAPPKPAAPAAKPAAAAPAKPATPAPAKPAAPAAPKPAAPAPAAKPAPPKPAQQPPAKKP